MVNIVTIKVNFIAIFFICKNFCKNLLLLISAANINYLPKLSPAQTMKLQHLTIISLASESKV